jgi:IS1 family transposase
VRGITVEQVQVDEIWAFVHCKPQNADLFADTHGDQYTFLVTDRTTKLIISHFVGKRTMQNSVVFMRDLKGRVSNRFQLSSDGFTGYIGVNEDSGAVMTVFGNNIDYGTEIKLYGGEVQGQRKYSPPVCIGARRTPRIGDPDRKMICTSHVERTNLSVRLFNRRFIRLTLGYSKKLENHKHAVALMVAHFNFCRKHSAHSMTPAMAAGITDHAWTVEELMVAQTGISYNSRKARN